MFRIVAVFAVFAASLSAARAGLNLIHDGSFSQAGAVGNITWNGFVSAASIQTGANPIVGWQTTAPDGQLEIWKAGADGIPAPIGATYWAELNAWYVSTLFQVVRLDLALPVSFSLAHRGRLGTDTMDLTIYDIGLATNWAPGQGTQVYSERMSDGNTAWGYYHNTNMFTPTAGNYYAFTFASVSSAGGDQAVGNFLSRAQFGYGIEAANAVPEPGTWAAAALLVGGAAFMRWRKRNSG